MFPKRLANSVMWLVPLPVLCVMLWVGMHVEVSTALAALATVMLAGSLGVVILALLWPLESIGLKLSVGASLGMATFALLASLCSLLRLSWSILVAITVIGTGLATYLLGRGYGTSRGGHRLSFNVPEVSGWTVGVALSGISLLSGSRNYPLTWDGTWLRYHPDMFFFEALSTSLAHYGPDDSIFIQGGGIRYHWLTYALAGAIAEVSTAEPFVVLTRVLPLVMMLLGSFLVASWTRSMTSAWWAPTFSVVLLFSGGYLGVTYGGVFNFDSPSQSFGAVLLVSFGIVATKAMSSGNTNIRSSFGMVSVVFLFIVSLMGAKVSAAFPALAGCLVIMLSAFARKEIWLWKATLVFFIALLASIFGAVVFLIGANGGGGLSIGSLVDRISSQQGLNPVDGMQGVVLGTIIAVLAVATRWICLTWLSADPQTRWMPATVFGWGLAVSSLLILALFNGYNELWFSTAASAPMTVLSAVAAAGALRYLGRKRRTFGVVLLAATGGVLCFAGVWTLWATGPSGGNVFVATWRWMAPIFGLSCIALFGLVISRLGLGRVSALGIVAGSVLVGTLSILPARALGIGTGQVGQLMNGIRDEWFTTGQAHLIRGLDAEFISGFTSTRLAAARWLRSNAAPEDVVATNITLDPFVPAVTHLRTYVSGIHYQAPYGAPELKSELLRRERESWAFIDVPSNETVKHLCDADVRWLWIDTERTANRNWQPWAAIEFSRPDVLIARIDSTKCP